MKNFIKKVVDRIYEFDFSNSELYDGREIIIQNGISEFSTNFRKMDMDKGIIVTPQGYTNGLFYRSSNGGEIYSSPKYMPDIVAFNLNVFGLKKGVFYKLTVIGRDTGATTFITNDRSVVITNQDNELLMNESFSGVEVNKDFVTLFRATTNEANLFFRVGKIFINDIILEEIEMMKDFDEAQEEYIPDNEYQEGKLQLVSFGTFSTEPIQNPSLYNGRYLSIIKYAGKGISLFLDTQTNQYVLERDNSNDTIGEPFTNINYLIDFNFNKVVNKGQFSQYNIVEVSPEVSPNTLKQGLLRFEFVDSNDNTVKYSGKDSRLTILIYKIY
jgi:hypothetical protein